MEGAVNALDDLATIVAERDALREALNAAELALSSYQYGNSAPDLAERVADHCAKVLKGEE